MQAIFDHVIDDLLEPYCTQTDFKELACIRDAIGRSLWTQLEGEQRDLLEQLQRAYDRAQDAELEAMFLASFDEVHALHHRHIA